ncbi:hypothetical protein OH767_51170 [Streptomyces sp. NBC_01614]
MSIVTRPSEPTTSPAAVTRDTVTAVLLAAPATRKFNVFDAVRAGSCASVTFTVTLASALSTGVPVISPDSLNVIPSGRPDTVNLYGVEPPDPVS